MTRENSDSALLAEFKVRANALIDELNLLSRDFAGDQESFADDIEANEIRRKYGWPSSREEFAEHIAEQYLAAVRNNSLEISIS